MEQPHSTEEGVSGMLEVVLLLCSRKRLHQVQVAVRRAGNVQQRHACGGEQEEVLCPHEDVDDIVKLLTFHQTAQISLF